MTRLQVLLEMHTPGVLYRQSSVRNIRELTDRHSDDAEKVGGDPCLGPQGTDALASGSAPSSPREEDGSIPREGCTGRARAVQESLSLSIED
ncbi:uncharacterized protein An02g05430 [Aspergillus niger]|uniref:Contig An02c0160, genomic contig n=2 Tax=Aspergillus niger TaxID=5061 RepID=A2QD10_ASPNC|nr:uncharacterized protein An02g05430 [Aspergillus niger]CAK47672.1 unnamed protein product [Aspergillus niger]